MGDQADWEGGQNGRSVGMGGRTERAVGRNGRAGRTGGRSEREGGVRPYERAGINGDLTLRVLSLSEVWMAQALDARGIT